MSEPRPDSATPTYDALSDKKRAWVDAYLRSGLNQTAASRSLGYKAPEQHGWRMSKDVEVQAAIEERLREAAMSADEVLFRLSEQARADIAEVFTITDDDGEEGEGQRQAHLDLVRLMEGGRSHLVKSITFTRNGPKVEMYDAQGALKELARILGLHGPSGAEDDPIYYGFVGVTEEERARRVAELERIGRRG